MPLTITINEAAPGTLTIGVGTPGVGVPNGGSTGTVLKKLSGADYDTGWASDISGVAWGAITGTLSTQIDLQTALDLKLAVSTAASTYQTLAGMSSYLTTSAAASTYQTLAGMSSYLTTATAASTYFTIANAANKANLASPSLTGTPLSTTAAVDTNTTQIATTAFVVAQAGAATPLVNGTAAVGTSLRYARADHVHPTDTSRAALASPSLTGTPLSTTAAADTNTTQIATTAFVIGQASSTNPAATGTAAVGTSKKYARADHVHLNPLPTGGTTGQVLSKVDATSYNVAWTTPSGGSFLPLAGGAMTGNSTITVGANVATLGASNTNVQVVGSNAYGPTTSTTSLVGTDVNCAYSGTGSYGGEGGTTTLTTSALSISNYQSSSVIGSAIIQSSGTSGSLYNLGTTTTWSLTGASGLTFNNGTVNGSFGPSGMNLPTGGVITFPDSSTQSTAGYPASNPSGFIGDAPSDSNLYGRLNAGWSIVPAPGIGDAPSDSNYYARINAAWSALTIVPMPAYYNSVWTSGGYVSASVTNIYDTVSSQYYNVLTF